ncbi:MAG: pyridoxamine 5'-phosphate oxidase [Acidobacteriota bacterium]|nr:pyridoxamine 5'-phosphate oxidase [Acidobacteriota bacterium]
MADLSVLNKAAGLDARNVDANPIRLFQLWFDEAMGRSLPLAEAMTLCTATADGKPSARMVLLKGVAASGFVFYTNYRSRKARELDANPFAALVFYWEPLERQVRVEGKVARISADESDKYFQTRPRESQLGAIVSPQSDVIESREVLEQELQELEERHSDRTIERPAHWGGYRLVPERIEFWKGRPGRLHDRLLYELQADGSWKRSRLAP